LPHSMYSCETKTGSHQGGRKQADAQAARKQNHQIMV